jgi:hypothetical protein
MNTCPRHNLRPGLPELPARIAALPVDARGYPVPFFASWLENGPDFRLADGEKLRQCLLHKLCWICGQPMGKHKTFAVGPMCVVNKTSSEPPSHLDCALWAVQACPFLSNPKAVRRTDDLTEANKGNVAGMMIGRNPGITCVWTTTHWTKFSDGRGGFLFDIGAPVSASWWREARPATRAEVLASMESGLPILREACHNADDHKTLELAVTIAMQLAPEL